MARRAQFGRRPRVQQNITGTLVSIAREMQAREDSNIMDAWRNGGTVHGRKVTDDMVLAYWEKRGKTLSKDDPTYDAIKNQIEQLTYGVAQSKQDLLHVQGKISDQQFASFYLKWAKKVPKNSEFWRVLQKDAASLLAQAKAKRPDGAAAAQKLKVENFNKFISETDKRDIAVGSALAQALEKIENQNPGMSVDINGDELLSKLTEDYRLHPNEYPALADALKARPGFDGNIDRTFFDNEMQRAEDGESKIAQRSKKDGFVSNMNEAFKGQTYFADKGESVAGWDTGKSYAIRYQKWANIMSDPSSTIADKDAATNEIGAWAQKAAQNPTLDEKTRMQLQVDANRWNGVEDDGTHATVAGFGGTHGRGEMNNPEMFKAIIKQKELVAAKAADPMGYVYAPTKPDGSYDETGKGPISIVPANSPGLANAVLMPVATGSGKPLSVAVAPTAVYSVDPNDKNKKTLIGYVVNQPVGGTTVQHFGYQDADGHAHWAPVSDVKGANVTEDKGQDGSLYWSVPAAQPSLEDLRNYASNIDRTKGTHLVSSIDAAIKNGASVDTLDINETIGTSKDSAAYAIKGGTITQTNASNPSGTPFRNNAVTVFGPGSEQWAATSVLDSDQLLAGDNGRNVSSSAAASGMKALMTSMTGDQARALLQDPEFQMAFITQSMNTLGTQNPLDPRIADSFRNAQAGGTWASRDWLDRNPGLANVRMDLKYPGQKVDEQGKPISITFGGQTIKVPESPQIVGAGANALNQQQLIPQGFTQAQMLAGAAMGFAPSPQATGVPGQLATPTPNKPVGGTITATPTATPGPTATPSPTPTPTPTPSPTPTPTTQTPGSGITPPAQYGGGPGGS